MLSLKSSTDKELLFTKYPSLFKPTESLTPLTTICANCAVVKPVLSVPNLKMPSLYPVIFNVQGVLMETVVGSIRKVDWSSMQVNFSILFPTGVSSRRRRSAQSSYLMTSCPMSPLNGVIDDRGKTRV